MRERARRWMGMEEERWEDSAERADIEESMLPDRSNRMVTGCLFVLMVDIACLCLTVNIYI